jgi:hypothetical protein
MVQLIPWTADDFWEHEEREFGYPKGHWMRCNDWSREL